MVLLSSGFSGLVLVLHPSVSRMGILHPLCFNSQLCRWHYCSPLPLLGGSGKPSCGHLTHGHIRGRSTGMYNLGLRQNQRTPTPMWATGIMTSMATQAQHLNLRPHPFQVTPTSTLPVFKATFLPSPTDGFTK